MTSAVAGGSLEHRSLSGYYEKDLRNGAEIVFLILIILITVLSVFPLYHADFQSSDSWPVPIHSGFQGTSYIPPVAANMTANSTSLYPNPYEIYHKEPAPMGITDYGIGANGVPYAYDSSSFMGVADVQSITVAPSKGNSTTLSFQLNVNLVFTNAGSLYVYWVQNVMSLNSSSRYVSFVDNIWNFSSQKASVYSSAVMGNGTIGYSGSQYFYYDTANAKLRGNDITFNGSYQAKIMVNVSTSSKGYPVVDFLYNDGYGWISYDKATFVVATNLTSVPAFLVDGIQYEPTGFTFYDAEFLIGGGGGGEQATIADSNVQLQLEYFNGHNYQMITNAYDFGSDTAEGVQNVTVIGEYYPGNGSLFSDISTGSGTLGTLYLESQVSIINISAPISRGILSVNGTSCLFQGGSVNVTLGPTVYPGSNGYYLFQIYDMNGALMWERNVSLYQGEFLALNISTFPVTFNENSFPNGTLWYLNLSNGESFNSTDNSITCYLPNGNYSYTASPAKGNYYSVTGSFEVNGSGLVVNVQFSPVQLRTYTVTFSETGLPTGTTWSVTVNGTTVASVGKTAQFQLPNGTYLYSIGNVSDFLSLPSTGIVTVSGYNVTVQIKFEEVYQITFSETGLPGGTPWYVNISGGNSYSSSSSQLSFKEVNGTYTYTISTGNVDYHALSGSFLVSGASLAETIEFTEVTYSVSISESGLLIGTEWSINLMNGQSFSSNSTSITINLPNGTYSYNITTLNKQFKPYSNGGSFVVNGGPVQESIIFNKVTYSVIFEQSGVPQGTLWTVSLNGSAEASEGSIIFNETNGTYTFLVSELPGFKASTYSGSITVSGSSAVESVVWSVYTYGITFTVTGIPAGTAWSLTINGTSFDNQGIARTVNSTGNSAIIDLPNGSYYFSIALPSGYHASNTNGKVNISGSTLSYSFKVNQPMNIIWIVIIGASAAAIAGVGGTFMLVRRKKALLVREERFTNAEEKKEEVEEKSDDDKSSENENSQVRP